MSDEELASVLAKAPRRRESGKRRQAKRKPEGEPRSPLICLPDGSPITASYVRRVFASLGRAAGIAKRVHPHGLRHTLASELRAEGIDIGIISEQLGGRACPEMARAETLFAWSFESPDLPPAETALRALKHLAGSAFKFTRVCLSGRGRGGREATEPRHEPHKICTVVGRWWPRDLSAYASWVQAATTRLAVDSESSVRCARSARCPPHGVAVSRPCASHLV